jgi:hypothetical protein
MYFLSLDAIITLHVLNSYMQLVAVILDSVGTQYFHHCMKTLHSADLVFELTSSFRGVFCHQYVILFGTYNSLLSFYQHSDIFFTNCVLAYILF